MSAEDQSSPPDTNEPNTNEPNTGEPTAKATAEGSAEKRISPRRVGWGPIAAIGLLLAVAGFASWQTFGATVKTKMRGAEAVVHGLPVSSEPSAVFEVPEAPAEEVEHEGESGERLAGVLAAAPPPSAGDGYGGGGTAAPAVAGLDDGLRREAVVRGRVPASPAAAAPVAPTRLGALRSDPTSALAAPTAPLPTSGVIASTFVGGSGTAARLSDLMDRGVMVGGESVRLTAFDELGRLPYGVPARDAVAVYAELERSRLLEAGERVHLQIALMAREGEAPPRPRMDIRLVLDRSGSMVGEKWDNAIRAAHALVDRLEPGDTFGLISYSDDASLDLAPTRVGDRRAAHAAVSRLAPGGATNIEAALRMATLHAPEHRRPTDVALVLLVSDGQATVGLTGATELGDLARASFDRSGVLTTSIGLGTDFDEATMLGIAREGSGSYHFVRRPEDVDAILRDELEERALAVAQDLRLRIVVAPGVIVHRVYGSRVLTDGEAAEVRPHRGRRRHPVGARAGHHPRSSRRHRRGPPHAHPHLPPGRSARGAPRDRGTPRHRHLAHRPR
jgi:Ca-activated chloride channel family protein